MKRNSVFDLLVRVLSRLSIPAAAIALLATPAGAVSANDPRGVWLRSEGGVQFSFYDCDGLLCAKVIAAKNPEDQSGVGTVILRGATKTGPNEWKGKLFNAEDGKTYDGFISLKSANELSLKGCLWGVLCSGETWTRVATAAQAPAANATVKAQTSAARPAAKPARAVAAAPTE
ncbi:DUF2147 domain-containing protein [Methylocystis sp. WRRC1]|uniref:DUF2147 domain-containing protein n=1 Tax=unclassified Methylocystis TaxID=2625913 RepID=UPI0001F86798|nr:MULTISPECIES: DUF2147 domain-containing protein [unclassified Methylocystis]MCC3245518.1 DUF2147 domain-containing protein [Methylocystis sp. WRRC1]